MARVIIIGDGPAGLAAALFLAKSGQETVVFAQDETLMHHAELHNYLGVPEIAGSEFQAIARRQVADVGAQMRDAEVASAAVAESGVEVVVDDAVERADYLIVAGGKSSQALAVGLGAEERDGAIVVDREARTSVDRVYAAGHLVRPERSQAIISAGSGAVAALDILSREAGKDVHDWDTPEG